MSNARGDEAKLLSRRQAAFGTAESAGAGAFYALPFYSYNVAPSEELNEDEAIYGDAYPGDAVAGLRNLAGSIVVPLGLNSFGWHLRNLLGAPTTTEISAGTKYEHVFETASLPSLQLLTQCMSHNRIDQHFVQDSVVYTSLEFQARKNGERARATANLVGREEVTSVATLDGSPVTYSPDPVPVGFTGLCLVDGVESAAVTGASVSLNAGNEPDQETLNGLATAAEIDWGRWELTGSIDTRFRDRTWYDRGNAGGLIDLHLKWVYSADYSFELVAHNIRVERSGIPVEGRGIISSSFNFRGNRPGSGETLITATLTNTAADYDNPA